jgi:Lysozyme like domain
MISSGVIMLASAGALQVTGATASTGSQVVTTAFVRPVKAAPEFGAAKTVHARSTLAAYQARLRQEAAAAARRARLLAEERQQEEQQAAAAQQPVQQSSPPASAGVYSYSGLEALWEQEGGSAATAATAACIAEHESSGNPAADNGIDLGIWQIDPGNFPGDNLLSATVNARDAVSLSDDGTNWSDWQTAPDCGV